MDSGDPFWVLTFGTYFSDEPELASSYFIHITLSLEERSPVVELMGVLHMKL